MTYRYLEVQDRPARLPRPRSGKVRSAVGNCCASMGFSLLALSVGAGLAGQAPDRSDPNSPRPPIIAGSTAEEAATATITLLLAEVARAIQHGDTLSLTLLVPDTLISSAERSAASALGCRSLAQVLTRFSGLSKPVGGQAPLLASIAEPVVVQAADPPSATITFIGRTALSLVTGKVGAARLPLQLEISPASHARQLAAVHGLLVGLCNALATP